MPLLRLRLRRMQMLLRPPMRLRRRACRAATSLSGSATSMPRTGAARCPPGPTPVRRALDAPLDSAPFPNADWGYGGSPDIGAPDGNVYPLMTALKLQNSSTKVYG
jgi:hypothetical protein